jgi:SAM-dependent methyltransferase
VKYHIIKQCSFCNGALTQVLDLGFLTPVNQLVHSEKDLERNSRLMVKLLYCANCGLTQLSTVVDENFLFPPDYPFRSGTTSSLRNNFYEQAIFAMDFLNLHPSDLVVDVGSNDGTLLIEYKKVARVLGIEPTDSSKVALENGIPTTQQFFSGLVAEEIQLQYGKATLITMCNVLAHVPDPVSLLNNAQQILRSDGTIIIEVHYLLDLIETLQFDSLYFEHLRFYDANSLKSLILKCNLEIFKIQKIDTHGGSIRIWAAKPGVHSPDSEVQDFLKNEILHPNFGKQGLEGFAKKVLEWRHAFRKMMSEIALSDSVILGIGAPSRGSMLLSFSGLDVQDVQSIGEHKDSPKLNSFLPDSRIMVVDEDFILSKNPDYLLLLSWHVADEIIAKLRAKGFKGKFIVPLPFPLILDN